MEDEEAFLERVKGRRIILDEIHRLQDPSQILKIAADHYPTTRVIATGSSTLAATARFRDTLTGRKSTLWLTPMTLTDQADFGNTDLEHRLSCGGLPPFFLKASRNEREFQEWIDDYWAKDILELFRLGRRQSFRRFAELLLANSGGVFQATRFSRDCEVSRTTVGNYLSILESTFVVHVLRPFSRSRAQEIVSAPKVYAFDTGFVCAFRGWKELRPEDVGVLWEHLVLNELHAHLQSRSIQYWRSKHGNEVDFVIAQPGSETIAIECKRSSDEFDPRGIRAFRARYPGGRNYVVATDVARSYDRHVGEIAVRFVSLADLVHLITGRPS